MVATVQLRTFAAALAIVIADGGLAAARAQEASAWVKDAHSSLRLLAGSRTSSVLLGGIEIQLQQGWKTYWRTPGDSGIPPRFDFSRSSNIESVTPLYPSPKTFADGAGGMSYGYQRSVTIPLRIVPKNANEPVVLRASVNYAVCEKLCLPVEAEAEVSFNSTASMQDSVIAAALSKVPKPSATTDSAPIALRMFRREDRQVIVDFAAQTPAGIELFAEGPSPDWSLPLPRKAESPGSGLIRFTFPLEGLPPNASAEGAILKLTVVGTDGAFEYNVRLN